MDNDIIEIIEDEHTIISPNLTKTDISNNNIEKKISDVKYDPIEPGKEEIELIEEVEPSKDKSGLALVIVLFVLLIVFIIFLPKITEIFGNLF